MEPRRYDQLTLPLAGKVTKDELGNIVKIMQWTTSDPRKRFSNVVVESKYSGWYLYCFCKERVYGE